VKASSPVCTTSHGARQTGHPCTGPGGKRHDNQLALTRQYQRLGNDAGQHLSHANLPLTPALDLERAPTESLARLLLGVFGDLFGAEFGNQPLKLLGRNRQG
jgi:hypothetical protein